MQQKDLIGIAILLMGIFGGVMLTTLWKRSRDFVFALMVWLAPKTEDYDVNFVSRDFYRGTTRGFEFSVVDILSISLLLSALLLPRRKGESRGYWPASLGLMLLFFFYACVSVGMSDPKLFGLFELSKMIRGIIMFLAVAFYLRTERELRWLLVALGASVCYQGLLGIRQRYWFGMDRVPGTLDDSNSLSAFLCTTAPIFVAALNARLPLLLKSIGAAAITLAYVGVLLTVSRAGFVIMVTILIGVTLATISYRITGKKIVFALIIATGLSAMTLKSWESLKSRFAEASLKREYGNNRIQNRGYYIRVARAIVEDRFCGVGLNNWSYWVSEKYGPMLGYPFVHYRGTDVEPSYKIPPNSNLDDAQAAPAHSLAALTAGELGIPGLVLLGMLWLRWFQMGGSFLWPRSPDPMQRIGVGLFFGTCGIFLQSITEWVFRHSPVFYSVHIILGALAALYFAKKFQKRELRRQAENEVAEEVSPTQMEPAPEFEPVAKNCAA